VAYPKAPTVIDAGLLAVRLQCRFAGLNADEAARAHNCSGWFRESYSAEVPY
jgi:hypothetical protein